MRRHLPRLLLMGALLSPMSLYALGLGEIRLNSALNQPFDAEIELLAPTNEELATLKVGLAGNELFSRYGIDRPAYLGSFAFSVGRGRDGRASIKVRSSRSVTEPFVTLLVEASWARGRLLREYTVLLDPPVFMPSQETPAPVTSAQSGAQNEGRIERPAPQPERAAPVPSPEQTRPARVQETPTEEPLAGTSGAAATIGTSGAAATIGMGGEYTVQRNDTLWRIASAANPGSRRVVNQTMIALFRANPQAFNGNINRLRAGSVLRIPEGTEIEAVSTSDASAEVARQTAEWSGAQPVQTAEEASRLRLVTPEEAPAAPTPAPTTQTPAAPQQPAATTAATPRPEDKRVELPSSELAKAQQQAEPTPAQPPAEATPPPTEEPAQTAPVAEESAQPTPQPARPPVKPAVEQPAGPSIADRIGEYWWAFVVLGLLVVAGVVLSFIRKRREESGDSLDSFAPLNFEPRSERSAPSVSPSATRARGESFLVETAADDLDDLDEEPAPPVTARRPEPPARPRLVEPVAPPPKVGEDTLSSETAVRFDQQDALAEADFHMAYGLYDQAADLVKIAIDREPQRRDLKLKLLEIYFVWGNKDLFLDTARELHSTRGQAAPGEWDKVLIMGKQIAPDDSMFQGEAASARVDLVDVNLEGGENRVDVDLFAEPEEDRPSGLDLEFVSGERQGPAQTEAEGDLDFLLDEPKRGSDDEPTRELDPLARTQETPTIESPMIDRTSQTIREKTDKAAFARSGTDQTAELSLDDLGLDVDALENAGSLEDTTSLEKDTSSDAPTAESPRPLRDDELTQLAPSISSFDRTLEAPRIEKTKVEKFDIESTGTIYIDQVDLSGGDTVEQARPDVDSTASMRRPKGGGHELDVDLDHLSEMQATHDATVRHPRREDDDHFSSDVFADRTAEVPRIDLDVGDPLSIDDREPTNKQVITSEMELSELEPVTMSEVGTKLDLARAYMDMGDPDGARSILEEVLAEGNPNQKQEAQRLMESIR